MHTVNNDQILKYLEKNGLEYRDKRDKQGCLWVLGGQEIAKQMIELKALGVEMHFKVGGGKITQGLDAWWTKDYCYEPKEICSDKVTYDTNNDTEYNDDRKNNCRVKTGIDDRDSVERKRYTSSPNKTVSVTKFGHNRIDGITMDNVYNDYRLNHRTYVNTLFKYRNWGSYSQLHPLFTMSQYIIDTLVDEGKKRIAIVLPDDNCSIIPLVVAKYFQFLQDDPSYAASIFEDIGPGQHVKLGKAVAEFLELDQERKLIKYKVGKETKHSSPLIITTPISSYHILLEKTEADVSTEKKWYEAVKRIKEEMSNQKMGMYIEKIKHKRTGVKKTIVLFTHKKNARSEFANLMVNGEPLNNVLAYGELNDDDTKPYSVLNKGKLDCLPGIAVSNQLSVVNRAIKTLETSTVSTVYCGQDKFQEIIDNLDAFKKLLKTKVPTVVFVPESEFEKYDILKELGFIFWQWKPATLKSECFVAKAPFDYQNSIFSSLAEKVNNAAAAEYKLIKCPSDGLAEIKKAIRSLWREDIDDVALRKVYVRINKYHKLLSSICTKLDGFGGRELYEEWDRTNQAWVDIRERFESNPIQERIDIILDSLKQISLQLTTKKAKALRQFVNKCSGDICVVLPDDYITLNGLTGADIKAHPYKKERFLSYSEFLELSNRGQILVDKLVVPWFDSSKYIRLKQTYCYNELVYILYDFENKWRSAFINRLDSSFSHDDLIETAKRIGIPLDSIGNIPFDSVDVDSEEGNHTKEDYDFDRMLLKKAMGKSYSSADLADSVECVPIILSEDTVAYFGINHDVIDITGLCNGDLDYAEKIPAMRLTQGKTILIRQSKRDLITEKADQLMKTDGKSHLRNYSSMWVKTLCKYAEGKTIQEVTDSITKAGYSCSLQQVRYWILGETIRPNDIQAIEAIANVSNDEELLSSLDKVYSSGGIVQEYHRRAGRWLSDELKRRADDILDIVESGNTTGDLEGIGAIHIYRVEEVMGKEYVPRNRVNTLEVFA